MKEFLEFAVPLLKKSILVLRDAVEPLVFTLKMLGNVAKIPEALLELVGEDASVCVVLDVIELINLSSVARNCARLGFIKYKTLSDLPTQLGRKRIVSDLTHGLHPSILLVASLFTENRRFQIHSPIIESTYRLCCLLSFHYFNFFVCDCATTCGVC